MKKTSKSKDSKKKKVEKAASHSKDKIDEKARKLLDKQTAEKEKLSKSTRSHHRKDKEQEVSKMVRATSNSSTEKTIMNKKDPKRRQEDKASEQTQTNQASASTQRHRSRDRPPQKQKHQEPHPVEKRETRHAERQAASKMPAPPSDKRKQVQPSNDLNKKKSSGKQEPVEEKKERTSRSRLVGDTEETISSPDKIKGSKQKLFDEHRMKQVIASQRTENIKMSKSRSETTEKVQTPRDDKPKKESRKDKVVKKVQKKESKKQKIESSSDFNSQSSITSDPPKVKSDKKNPESDNVEMEVDQIIQAENDKSELDQAEQKNDIYWDFSNLIKPADEKSGNHLKLLKELKAKYSCIANVTEDEACKPYCEACFQRPEPPILNAKNIDENINKSINALYTLVFCTECFHGVHLNCLGYDLNLFSSKDQENLPFKSLNLSYNFVHKSRGKQRLKTTVLIYKCEVCQRGSQEKPECQVCFSKEGFMKKIKGASEQLQIEGMSQSSSQQKMNDFFVHQVCAISFPEHFLLDDPHVMTFMLKDQHKFSQSQSDKSKKQEIVCNICKNSQGMLIDCYATKMQKQFQLGTKITNIPSECHLRAHPYCAQEQDLEYKQMRLQETFNKNGKFQDQRPSWTSQICGNFDLDSNYKIKAVESQIIYWCVMHSGNSKRDCYGCTSNDIYRMGVETTKKIQDVEMVECEKCCTWNHQICDKITEEKIKNPENDFKTEGELFDKFGGTIKQSEYAEGKEFICHKCKGWNTLFESPLVQGIFLGKNQNISEESYQGLINEDKTTWKYEWMPTLDVWLTEHSMMEQILQVKLWNFLCHVLNSAQVTETMRKSHITQIQSIIFNNSRREIFQKQTDLLVKEAHPIRSQNEQIAQTIDSADKVDSKAVRDNKKLLTKLIDQFKDHKIICSKNEACYHMIVKLKILERATQIFTEAKNKEQKPSAKEFEEMRHLLTSVDKESDKFIQQHRALQFLQKGYDEFMSWQTQLFKFVQLENTTQNTGDLQKRLRDFRRIDRGLSLVNRRYKELKKSFTNKNSTDMLTTKIREAEVLDIDTKTEVKKLKEMYNDNQALENAIWKIASSKDQSKPLQKIRNMLIQIAAQPVKPPSADHLLELWMISARWHALAKSFIQDKHEHNSIFLFYFYRNQLLKNKEHATKKFANGTSSQSEKDENLGKNQTMLKIQSIFDPNEVIELQKNLIFEHSSIQKALIDPLKSTPFRKVHFNENEDKTVFCDSALAIEVKDKAALIFDLVESHKEILRDKHEVKDLEKYLTMVKNIENFDFTDQIDSVTKKISEGEGEGQGENKTKKIKCAKPQKHSPKKLNVVIEANEVVNPVQSSDALAKSKSAVSKSGKAEKGILPADQKASILITKMRAPKKINREKQSYE